MDGKVCETYAGAADKAVTGEPTIVDWVVIAPTALATVAILYIRDGFSAADEIRAYIYSGQGTPFNFIPPFRCAHGLFVDVVSGLAYFTIGYRRERNIPQEP